MVGSGGWSTHENGTDCLRQYDGGADGLDKSVLKEYGLEREKCVNIVHESFLCPLIGCLG